MSAVPIFDANIHDQLRGELGAENATELVKMFLTDTSRMIGVIAADQASRAAVRLEAHAIKSSAATLGFERLSQLARALETGAGTMEAAALAQSIGLLEGTFEETAVFAKQARLSA
jgi:HPt (histidine-containing phosphotransfer) domain-containing protein